jgi:hypothetical protein
MKSLNVFFILLFIFSVSSVLAAEKQILFREDFNHLDNWQPLYFPKIKTHSTYGITKEGTRSYLRTESRASASALIYKNTFNVYDYPRMRWRWKVENTYKNGNPKEKSGDDYPLRIYVMFQYDPNKADITEKLRYGLAKTFYGTYPPHSTMNYVWTGHDIPERIITSPYTNKAKMIILEQGKSKVGHWLEENVNIPEDYQKAFGKAPPATAGIAVMNDSDNTGERSVSLVDFIEVFR